MSNRHKNIDFHKIEEIVEGDLEFRKQLLEAIILAVKELEVTYIKGIESKNLEWIKQARHKIKPTLGLFDLHNLAVVLGQGKRLMTDEGFTEELEAHKREFLKATREVLEEVNEIL